MKPVACQPMPGTGARRYPECWAVYINGYIVYQGTNETVARMTAERLKVRNEGVQIDPPEDPDSN